MDCWAGHGKGERQVQVSLACTQMCMPMFLPMSLPTSLLLLTHTTLLAHGTDTGAGLRELVQRGLGAGICHTPWLHNRQQPVQPAATVSGDNFINS